MQWFDIINPYRYDSLIRIEELGWHFIQEGHERIHQPSSHTLGAHVPRLANETPNLVVWGSIP